jgi:hypothetical protein
MGNFDIQFTRDRHSERQFQFFGREMLQFGLNEFQQNDFLNVSW